MTDELAARVGRQISLPARWASRLPRPPHLGGFELSEARKKKANMVGFFLRRIGTILVTMFAVLTAVFFLARLSGDPARVLVSADATQEYREAFRSKFGLDLPVLTQYRIFMSNVILHGDFGDSYRFRGAALPHVLARAVPTLKLALAAMCVALLIGIPCGLAAGLKPNGLLDVGVQTFALLGQSMPTFWLGIMLIIVFAVKLKWLPVLGRGSPLDLVLPALTLGFSTAALIARMLRVAVIDIASEDFIRTARAKGLRESTVILRHILRSALIPVITIVMVDFGFLMGGAIVTETVFNYPGMGLLAIQAIYARDFVVVQVFVVFSALLVTFANLLADFLYALIDPRVEYE